MSPVFRRESEYTFKIYSNEEERMHIHVICGYYGDPTHHCACTSGQIQRHMNRISGPLLDRIDIHCEIQAVPFAQLSQLQPGEPSEKIRNIQTERFRSSPQSGGVRGTVYCNLERGDWAERGI